METAAQRNAQWKLVAQVACEAIVNDPLAYDHDTVEAVKATAKRVRVSGFYLDQLDAL